MIVLKPWGREYCCYRGDGAAIWMLEIAAGASTSLHAHRRKHTTLVVLEGEVRCHGGEKMGPLDALDIAPGHPHRTSALKDACVLEIERPDDKEDLVRYEDDYGRGQGMEAPSEPLSPECVLLADGSIREFRGWFLGVHRSRWFMRGAVLFPLVQSYLHIGRI